MTKHFCNYFYLIRYILLFSVGKWAHLTTHPLLQASPSSLSSSQDARSYYYHRMKLFKKKSPASQRNDSVVYPEYYRSLRKQRNCSQNYERLLLLEPPHQPGNAAPSNTISRPPSHMSAFCHQCSFFSTSFISVLVTVTACGMVSRTVSATM